MIRGRAILRLSIALVLCSPAVFAEPRSTPVIDRNILTGGGPATTHPAARQPYFFGWTAQVDAPPEILKLPKEPGGVGVDPATGWVYVSTRDGHLTCLDAGKEVWSTDIGGILLAPPTVHRNVVVAGTAEGVVHILNKVTGARIARSILGEELITQPVIDEDAAGHMRAYIGTTVESLFAINVEDGLKMWRAHRDAPSGFTIYGFSRPIVTANAVFVGFADGTIESLDPATGVVKWEKHVSPPGDMLDVDGLAWNGVNLFAASYSGGVYSFDPATGNQLWQTKLPQMTRLVSDGLNVYAGGPGLWAGLRADNGFVFWKFTFGNGAASTSGALSGPLLIFAEEDGPIYFVDKRSGEGVGIIEMGEGFSSPPALLGNVLFAMSNYGRVYSAVVAP